jgi:pimeloyl-ACP methyl ester carboxylesterase
VLVHGGFRSSASAWTEQDPLAAAFELVAVDRAGHGGSPADAANGPDAQADDVAAALAGGAHLVGHSYGGVIAMRAAARHPDAVRSLCLLEPPAFALVRGHADVEAFVARLEPVWAGAAGDDPLAVRNAFYGAFGLSARRRPLTDQEQRDVDASRREVPPWEIEVPDRVRVPVLAVSGGWPAPPPGMVSDAGARAAARGALHAVCDALEAAGARREHLPAAGHDVQSDRRFNTVLERFLAAA